VAGRLRDGESVGQALAEASDDEQGVVDADADADHHGQERRDGGNVHQGADQGDARQPHQQPDQGGADGQAHRDHRPECHQQDEHGGAKPEQLGRAGLGLAGDVDDRAAELHGQAGPAGGVARAVQPPERLGGDLPGLEVGADGGEGDRPVGRDGAGPRVQRIVHPDDVGLAPELGQGGGDPHPGVRVADRAALGVEHDGGVGPGHGREAPQQQVGRALGLDPGDAVVVSEGCAGRLAQRDDGGGDPGPGSDHPPAASGGEPAQAVQELRHGAFLVSTVSEPRGNHTSCKFASTAIY
jgi:hypothetical protein